MAAVRYGFRESRFFKFKVGLSFLDCQSVWDCPCELGWHVQTYQKKERSTPCILNQSLFLQLTKEQYWLWTHTCLCGCLFLPAWALVKIGKKNVWEVMSKIFLSIRVSLDLHFELLKKKGKITIAYYYLMFTTYSVMKILHFGLISSLLSHVCTILYLSGRNQKWAEKSGN